MGRPKKEDAPKKTVKEVKKAVKKDAPKTKKAK
jgi:hypothetical protein